MKHQTEEELLLFHYGEGAARASAEQHLAACEACRASYEALKSVLAAVESVPVPARPENYEGIVWQRVRARLDERRGFNWPAAAGWRAWFAPRRLAAVAALAALALAAFYAGRNWPRPRPEAEIAGPSAEQVRERILLVAVGDHLDRSQMVLVELANAPAGRPVNISAEQAWARDLVDANRLYRQSAARAGEAGLGSVLDELERVLMEIANRPSEVTPAELEQIQQRIQAQGILFKVRVIGAQVRERQKPAARRPVEAAPPAGARKSKS